jgi:hypothetical protein
MARRVVTPEFEILNAVMVAVSSLPSCMIWRENSGVGRTSSGAYLRAGTPGIADIMGVCRGRAIALECKTERGKQSRQQMRFQVAFEKAGGLYAVVRSADEALTVLESIA